MEDVVSQSLTASILLLSFVFLLVCLQEAINGFHDAANAVACAIYTRSLDPIAAIIVCAGCNFIGVVTGGTAVAFTLVYLLPIDMITSIDTLADTAFILAMILAAVTWNFTTWYFGIPNSTTHSYIGSILGVAAAFSTLAGSGADGLVPWREGEKVMLVLIVSPLFGFILAAILYRTIKLLVRDHRLYDTDRRKERPPNYVRGVMIFGTVGVSFLHGTNDGQKSIGFMMLILIGIAPAVFGINANAGPAELRVAAEYLAESKVIAERLKDQPGQIGRAAGRIGSEAADADDIFIRYRDPADIPPAELDRVRRDLIELLRDVSILLDSGEKAGLLNSSDISTLVGMEASIKNLIEHVPIWVILLAAFLLGAGTAIGYKRIVVTLGERIGKLRMSPADGTAAQVTAMTSIAVADGLGMPVSTTHVLSSGVAGAMMSSGAGLQWSTVRGIVITWVTTLPGTFALSFALSWLFHTLLQ